MVELDDCAGRCGDCNVQIHGIEVIVEEVAVRRPQNNRARMLMWYDKRIRQSEWYVIGIVAVIQIGLTFGTFGQRIDGEDFRATVLEAYDAGVVDHCLHVCADG